MKNCAALLLILLLNGCAWLRPIAEDPDTFAVCKTADVVTTGYALSTGRFIEKNPLVAPLVSQGILPLAIISFAIWYIVQNYSPPEGVIAANTITCPVAAHNAWLLLTK